MANSYQLYLSIAYHAPPSPGEIVDLSEQASDSRSVSMNDSTRSIPHP